MEISVSANNQSPPQVKIALFRSFFRGREEVYPKRFENKKTGKAGYVFACGNEWVRGICEKPKIKCSDCKHRRLLPITDDVVHWHEHLDFLLHQLTPHIQHLVVLRGGMKTKELAQVTNRLATMPENEERVLLATGRYIGEGFDDARLDTLFLTLPISWQGTIAQYVGRLHRLNDRKKEVQVYDYADLNVPILERMFNKRCRGYEAVGYKILLPASATPGWPTQAPLPVDPAWKSDYAASIKRLICDGVDMPLANLFVQVASVMHADAEGIDRARSATEAFLYRRLETLPQTAGRFHLNALLSIPFDISSQMEVDLLCADARLAVELDGAQHLADANAYRRDRRKDALLQQNGYMVLRFLSEDVGKHLDDVLNSILRALTHQETLQKGKT